MAVLDCPQPSVLASFCDGLINDEESSLIAAHVEECTQCQDSLETLVEDSPDALLRNLRRSPEIGSQFAAEPMCQNIVERIGQLNSFSSILPRQANVNSDEQSTQPEFIGNYKVLRHLGQGGMGTVYQALHVDLDKVVAIKMLTERLAGNAAAVTRFHREMKAVGKLQHPNIVAAFDAGNVDGTHYLVMEFVDGIDLSELLRRKTMLAIPDACELVRQAAWGLEHAARRGLVHRDIKPSNLILTLDGEGKPLVKILDLGLALLDHPFTAKSPSESKVELTWSGQVMGSVDFMSPEQALDSHDVDIRADVYALGATLYKFLTGVVPLSREGNVSLARKLAILAYESAPSINLRRSDLPANLASLVDSMLSRDRDQRPSTPGEVAQRLAPFANGCQLGPLLAEVMSGSAEASSPLSQTVVPANFDESTPGMGGTIISLSREQFSKNQLSPPSADLNASNGVSRTSRLFRPFLLAVLASVCLLVGLVLRQIFYVQTPHGYIIVDIKDPQIKVTLGDQTFSLEDSEHKYEVGVGEHTLRVQHREQTFETDKFILSNGKTERFKIQLLPGKIRVLHGEKEIGSDRVNRVSAIAKDSKRSIPRQKTPAPSLIAAKESTRLSAVEILTSPDWEWTEPENLGPAVNTSEHECSPHFSADGRRLWFHRGYGNDLAPAWVSVREASGEPWSHAKSIGKALDFAGPMADAFISRDERTWLFVTWGAPNTMHIMESTRPSTLADWSTPRTIEAAGVPAQFPVLSEDGLTLYLMKNFLGNEGDEICVMTRTKTDSPWSKPTPLTPPVNLNWDERPLWISADGLILVFHSTRDNIYNYRQFDLWLTTRASLSDPWREPVNFGPRINSALNDAGAALSEDGRELIFESERPGGLGQSDLYRAFRVPKSNKSATPTERIKTSLDRSVAEWALKLNAILDVAPNLATMGKYVRHVTELPEGDFLIRKIDFTSPHHFQANELADLASLKGLGTLGFQDQKINEDLIKNLRRLPRLNVLELRSDHVVVQNIEQLNSLGSLRKLCLYGDLISESELEAVTKLSNINWLELRGGRINDDSLTQLLKMHQLEGLIFVNSPITGSAIERIVEMNQLTHLHFVNCPFSDVGLKSVVKLEHLDWLNLDQTLVTDDGMQDVAKMTWLKRLTLVNTDIGDSGIAHLKSISALNMLDLRRTKITDAAVEDLAAMTGLFFLQVGPQLSDEAVQSLRKRLPNCNIDTLDAQ
jgi:serine/threonine protein kinase